MNAEIVTVSSDVMDRRTGRVGWAVVAAYVTGEHGDPVCVEYRVRQVRRGERKFDDVVNLHRTIHAMEDHAEQGIVGEGPFDPVGIPRYVFEAASQGRLLDRARANLARGGRSTEGLSTEAKALLTPPAHKPGRPPQRSMLVKLQILQAAEKAHAAGQTLEDVAQQFHMSRSAVRDLLSWARRDASPRLFTGAGQGRRGGEMTPEARAMLSQIEGQ
ncbi:hypothetical protein [Nocardioides sp.]|uniref:hypothetical protein n=1 Tax=Nocardioides sp. TaxID=35761 RepID=UPI002BD35CCD|nr:hypothetical protein [Nocardioides sp.]HXH78181.1 hypothetical protein [Nocardioides sp.]